MKLVSYLVRIECAEIVTNDDILNIKTTQLNGIERDWENWWQSFASKKGSTKTAFNGGTCCCQHLCPVGRCTFTLRALIITCCVCDVFLSCLCLGFRLTIDGQSLNSLEEPPSLRFDCKKTAIISVSNFFETLSKVRSLFCSWSSFVWQSIVAVNCHGILFSQRFPLASSHGLLSCLPDTFPSPLVPSPDLRFAIRDSAFFIKWQ